MSLLVAVDQLLRFLARGNSRLNYGFFKYIQALVIATIPGLYHMYNEIMQNSSELKVSFAFLKYFGSKNLCFLSSDIEL